uniref:Uncharacterized protein n=1 Tax=Avena sativa TaxID=4498 RepID=A0ACD5XYN4_AVESA
MQHTMADGAGMVQFLAAVADLARGAVAPTVRPVWGRELLMASHGDPSPRPRFAHREYDEVPDADGAIMPFDDLTHRSLFFGPLPPAAFSPSHHHHLRAPHRVPVEVPHDGTMALAPAADETMRMICIVNLRGPGHGGSIPRGYYGNAFAFPVAMSTAGDLCANPVGYAVELVMKAKREVDMEYVRSVARLMVRRGRPHFAVANAYLVSDVSKAGIRDLDYGWEKSAYTGPAKGGVGVIPGVASFLIAVKNAMGEDGIAVPVCLPRPAIKEFMEEMSKLMRPVAVGDTTSRIISAI